MTITVMLKFRSNFGKFIKSLKKSFKKDYLKCFSSWSLRISKTEQKLEREKTNQQS